MILRVRETRRLRRCKVCRECQRPIPAGDPVKELSILEETATGQRYVMYEYLCQCAGRIRA